MTRELVEKMRIVVTEPIPELGRLDTAALVFRSDAERWDLVVSASWISTEVRSKVLEELSNRISSALDSSELINIGSVAVLPPDLPFIKGLRDYMAVPDGPLGLPEIVNTKIGNIDIKRVLLLFHQGLTFRKKSARFGAED